MTLVDRTIIALDQGLRAVFSTPNAQRSNPAEAVEASDQVMSIEEQAHVAGLMRVNHTGEVCAQALYMGHSVASHTESVKQRMDVAAQEENDHLKWCHERLGELNSRPSLLNPFWYSGSFVLGAVAGMAGDKWALGFVAETEKQVEAHLDNHLQQLPRQDIKSRAIIEQMIEDERKHGEMAMEAGGVELPGIIKLAMKATSKVMTTVAYRI